MTKRTTSDGKDLERLVHSLEGLVAAMAEGDRPRVVYDARALDAVTKDGRQIDVAVYHRDGDTETLVQIECRDLKRRVDVEQVEQLKQKRDDIGAAKLLIVSVRGFTANALTKAKHYGIETLTVRSGKITWPAWVLVKSLRLTFPRFEIVDGNFHLRHRKPTPPGRTEIKLDDPVIVDPEKRKHSLTEVLASTLRREKERDGNFLVATREKARHAITISFPGGKYRVTSAVSPGREILDAVSLEFDLWEEAQELALRQYTYATTDGALRGESLTSDSFTMNGEPWRVSFGQKPVEGGGFRVVVNVNRAS